MKLMIRFVKDMSSSYQLIFYFLILMIFYPIDILSQKDYYKTDTSQVFGIKLVNAGSTDMALFCRVKKFDKIIKYTPDEIIEYSFQGGSVYVSKSIKVKDSVGIYFLERLNNGKADVYYIKMKDVKRFYIERDSGDLEVFPEPNSSDKDFFSAYLIGVTSDCNYMADAARLVRYNKRSVTKYFKRYEECKLKPFPFFKYGAFVGMMQSNLMAGAKVKDFTLPNADFKPDYSFYFGIFMDAPILVSDFSFYISVGYFQSSFSTEVFQPNLDTDYLIDLKTIKTPIMLRYTIPANNVRPFAGVGLNYLFNAGNENKVYQTLINGDLVETGPPEEKKLVDDHMLGFSVGAGLQIYLSYKRILSIEARFNKDYPISNNETLNWSGIEFFAGINF